MPMIYIGCHLSVTDGYEAMGKKIRSMNGDTFAWFTRNPRGGRTKAIAQDDVEALLRYCRKEKMGPLAAHASYTMNLCSANEETRKNGFEMLARDMEIMMHFPGSFYNFHPGSHTGQRTEAGIRQISDALNRIDHSHTTILLETMAGKGSEIGGTFEELREIIDRTDACDNIGVCFDTCHVWDAGYDVVNDLDGVLQRFDDVVGISRIKAVHFNDSKNECGSHRDRHEKLGQGLIGTEAMKRIALHPKLQGLPFILETPNEDSGYIEEIQTVRSWFEEESFENESERHD